MDKLDEEESKFLHMTDDEIQEHNAHVRMRADTGIGESVIDSAAVPVWDLRGDFDFTIQLPITFFVAS